jgi:hypothetical protein
MTIYFLNKRKASLTTPAEFMPKSPDAAPMAYVIWGTETYTTRFIQCLVLRQMEQT